jgi:WD40 repeat protein
MTVGHLRSSTLLALVAVLSCAARSTTPATVEPASSTMTDPVTRDQPELVVQSGYEGSVSAIAISPNDEWVMLGGASGIAGLFELRTGRLVRRFVHQGLIHAAEFSPDGRFIVTATFEGEVQLWGVQSGARLREYTGKGGPAGHLAFSADGRKIVALSGDVATVWESDTARPIVNIAGAQHDIRSVALSPDGNWVAVALWSGEVQLKSTRPGEQGRTVVTHQGGARAVAFSSDSEWLASGGSDGVAVLSQVRSAAPMQRFEGHAKAISALAISPNKRVLITGSDDGEARLWAIADGTFAPISYDTIRHVRFSRSGDQVLLAGDTGGILIDSARDRQLEISSESHRDGGRGILSAFAFTHDSEKLVVGFSDGVAKVLNLDSTRYVDPFVKRTLRVSAVAFSPDDRLLLTGNGDGTVAFWDLYTGKPRDRLSVREAANEVDGRMEVDFIRTMDFDANGEHLLLNLGRTARLLETASAREIQRFPSNGSAALSPDGHWVVTGQQGVEKVWNARTGEVARALGTYGDGLQSVSFSRSSQRVLLGEYHDTVARLWDVSSGTLLRELPGEEPGVSSVALWGNDDGFAATGGRWGGIHLWNLGDPGAPPKAMRHGRTVGPILFSPDGRYLITIGNGATRFWNVADAQELKSFANPARIATDADMTQNSRWLAVSDVDGNTVIWDTANEREAVRVLSLTNGGWVAIAPDGRFDTDALEHIEALDWVMPDDPMRLLPIETFMRDYYEPRLLSRVLADEPMPKVRSLTTLNRAQPKVALSNVQLAPTGDSISLDVRVQSQAATFHGKNGPVTNWSGMSNLRLFRDRKLVGYTDGPMKPGRNNTASIHFKNIRLPRGEEQRSIKLSAFAFNTDGVKSSTATASFDLPAGFPRWRGRAYLITVGVNSFSNSAWNLDFAANDARAFGNHLERELEAGAQFEQVILITLVADKDVHGQAKKEVLKGVFEVLAGKPIRPELREEIPNVDRLQEARPEDLVVVSLSTHGYAGRNGSFHLFPEDIAPGNGKVVDDALLASTISGDDLTNWWRPVDAGEMVLIIDACQSAAAVEGDGSFKPGPLGNRGLGQLAYDKGMRVLVASQATDGAVESGNLKHGLLTYSLITNGLENGLADHAPKDGEILLDEWLTYGVRRVPSLYTEILSGGTEQKGVSVVYGGRDQTPSLFDFAGRTSKVRLRGPPAP